jgi:hypothetical protein
MLSLSNDFCDGRRVILFLAGWCHFFEPTHNPWCVFEAECGSLVDGGACAFLKLAQWDFNNFIPASTGVYENYGVGEPHGKREVSSFFPCTPPVHLKFQV